MSSFDYLKTAIKQQGCTLQQVADASGMTKGYLSQLLNAKIKAPARKNWRRYTVSRAGVSPSTEKHWRGVR